MTTVTDAACDNLADEATDTSREVICPLQYHCFPEIVEQIFAECDYITQLTVSVTNMKLEAFINRLISRDELVFSYRFKYPMVKREGRLYDLPFVPDWGDNVLDLRAKRKRNPAANHRGVRPPSEFIVRDGRKWYLSTKKVTIHNIWPRRHIIRWLPHLRPDCSVRIEHFVTRNTKSRHYRPARYRLPKIAKLTVEASHDCDCDNHKEWVKHPKGKGFGHGAEDVELVFQRSEPVKEFKWMRDPARPVPDCNLMLNLVTSSVLRLTMDCQVTCAGAARVSLFNISNGFAERGDRRHPSLQVLVKLHTRAMVSVQDGMKEMICRELHLPAGNVTFEVPAPVSLIDDHWTTPSEPQPAPATV